MQLFSSRQFDLSVGVKPGTQAKLSGLDKKISTQVVDFFAMARKIESNKPSFSSMVSSPKTIKTLLNFQ